MLYFPFSNGDLFYADEADDNVYTRLRLTLEALSSSMLANNAFAICKSSASICRGFAPENGDNASVSATSVATQKDDT